jgi:hypothetical protein
MPDRLVRFAESFFDDLDAQLPAERSADGAASVTDFLLYDLPRLRDSLAADFEGRTLPVPDLEPLRVLIAAGTLVRSVALYVWLDPTGQVIVVAVDIERRTEDDVDEDGDR